MRYIDLNELLKSRREWGNQKDLWKNRKLKSDFRDFFHNKCWYSEVKLVGQDAPIDHFRPKSAVLRYKDYPYNEPLCHSGYSWLSSDPSNYRICCIYANRVTGEGGKGCYFPLSDDSERLTEGGTEQEIPLLLDPCNREDVQLISFMGNRVIATSPDPYCEKRIEASASIYNLNHKYIAPERTKVWVNVEKTLAEYFNGEIARTTCIRILKDSVDKNAPFSACAIACVNSLAPGDIKAELDLVL